MTFAEIVKKIEIVSQCIAETNALFDRVAYLVSPYYYQYQHTFPAVVSVEFNHLLAPSVIELLRLQDRVIEFGFRQVFHHIWLEFCLFAAVGGVVCLEKSYQIKRNGELQATNKFPWWRMSRESIICCYAICVAGERLVEHFLEAVDTRFEENL